MVNHQPFTNLIEILCNRAKYQSHLIALTFLEDGENREINVTYEELDLQAKLVAAQLQNIGISNKRALLLYPPGIDFIIAFFGCLYAEVVAVPLYPPKRNRNFCRLQTIASDSKPSIILTTSSLLANIKSKFTALRCLTTDNLVSNQAIVWQNTSIPNDRLAFIQYTSGSTRKPKGVMISHKNLMYNLATIHNSFEHTSESRGVTWLPLYHDMGLIGGVLQPIYSGFHVTLMSPVAFLQKPFRWLQAISRYQATTSGAPNFAYDLVCRQVKPEQLASLDLSCWEVAFTGSEPIRAKTLKRFATTFASCGFRSQAFYPCYGLAESTLFVSGGSKTAPYVIGHFERAAFEQNIIVETDKKQEGSRAIVGCGRSWFSQKISIVDPKLLTRCDANRVGEIWVSSDSVAQGYWNQKLLTKQTFDAYIINTGEGPFLRTGDLGFLHKGDLFVTGRLKNMIIIRGRNYYPHDIEFTAQQSHPALKPSSCAVFSIDMSGQERIIIVQEVKRRSLRNLQVEKVVRAIRQEVFREHNLQIYAVILLKPGKLPKTSSGKIQHYACKAAFYKGTLDKISESIVKNNLNDTIQPKLDIEELLLLSSDEQSELLANCVKQKISNKLDLDTSQINLQHSFIQLGLDSLMITQIKHQLEIDFGVELSLIDFFKETSVIQVANQILLQLNRSSACQLAAVAATHEYKKGNSLVEQSLEASVCPVSRNRILPLSLSQQRSFSLERFSTLFSHIPIALRISGSLEIDVLARSLKEIISRHEVLRTVFVNLHNQPNQSVIHEVFSDLQIIDIGEQANNEEIEIRRTAIKEFSKPFNLEESLLRFTLLRLKQKEYLFLITIHHMICDGWSVGIFLQELEILYKAFSKRKSSPLPKLFIQYGDYACWQNQWMQGKVLQAHLEYWKKQFSKTPKPLKLTTVQSNNLAQPLKGRTKSFTIPTFLTAQLKTLCRKKGTTLFMLLLTIFKILLFCYSEQEDLLVGVPFSGRNHVETHLLIGFFTNMLPLRTNISGNPTFEETLSRVRKVVLDAHTYQSLPYRQIKQIVHHKPSLNLMPFISVRFSFENFPLSTPTLSGLRVNQFPIETGFVKGALTLFIREQANQQLDCKFEYSCEMFSDTKIAHMIQVFRTLVEIVIVDSKICLSELRRKSL